MLGVDRRVLRKHEELEEIEKENQVNGSVLRYTSQQLAVTSPADITIYYGNRGGGKSVTLLLHFAQYLDAGYGDFYLGVVLANEWEGLANVIHESERMFTGLPGAQFYKSQQQASWTFRCGAELLFRYCSQERHYAKKVHGKSIAWLGIEEATVWATPVVIDKAISTVRPGFLPKKHSANPDKLLPPLRGRVFMTCNPSEVGRVWFKEKYVKNQKPGKIETEVFNIASRRRGRSVMIPEKKTTVLLFSSMIENPHYSEAERAFLYRQCKDHRGLWDMWVLGKWDVSVGGAFEKVWRRDVHVVPRFVIPDGWYVDRSLDWGSTNPTAVVWWAESDGKEVMIDGRRRTFPKGTLFAIQELYTCREDKKYEGTQASVMEVSRRIKRIESELLDYGIISVMPDGGPADVTIGRKNDRGSHSIRDTFDDNEIYWEESDSSRGARINGLVLLKQRFGAAFREEDKGTPSLYICDNCVNIIRTIPTLNHDEKRVEDIRQGSTVEDHLYDAMRYRALTPDAVKMMSVGFAD